MARICAIAILAAVLWVPGLARAADSFDDCTGYIDALPANITAPGTWCLRKDLSTPATGGYGILLDADAVVLDCKGFQIDGRTSTMFLTHGVFMYGNHPHDRATVRNCTVRGYGDGIWLIGDEGVVEDNRVIGTKRLGIVVSGANGIVRRNQVLQTGGLTGDSTTRGIEVADAGDVIDNVVSGFATSPDQYDVDGIVVSGGVGGTVRGNRIRMDNASHPAPADTRVNAIWLFDTAGAIVRDNLVVGEGVGQGIACYGTASAIAKDNFLVNMAQASTCTDGGGNSVAP